MEILGGEDNEQIAVDIDDIPLAELAGDDFQGEASSTMAWAAQAFKSARTIAILPPTARGNVSTTALPSPFWSPDRHADRRPFLLARNRIVAALRRWFEAEGF